MNRKLRIALAASLLAAVAAIAGARASTPTPAQAGIDLAGTHGFDFLVGEWRVHHRRISAVSKKWVEFDGTMTLRLSMEGVANMEEHWLNSPDGVYRAVGLRSYDSKTDQWSIWWLDSRCPSRPLDPPAQAASKTASAPSMRASSRMAGRSAAACNGRR